MRVVTGIGTQGSQKLSLFDENNQSIVLELFYRPRVSGWYFNLNYQGFAVNGQKITTSLNFLRKYSNKLPFGIGCLSEDLSDPYFVDDFSSGRCRLTLLDQSEVNLIEELYT